MNDRMLLDGKSSNNNIVVIYVDIDGDIDRCGIQTPVKGYSNVLDAAMKFAICNPRDSDTNAIFEAIRIYRELAKTSQNLNTDIVLISGPPEVPRYLAFLKIEETLKILKDSLNAQKAIVVLDSVEDEKAVPIIGKYFDVINVEKVVVVQSKTIEYAYTILSDILRKIIYEKEYSRIFLGYPGIIILILTILAIFNVLNIALYIVSILVSILMILRGFNLVPKMKYLATNTIKLSIYGLSILLNAIFIALLIPTIINNISNLEIMLNAIKLYLYLPITSLAILIIPSFITAIRNKAILHLINSALLIITILFSYILAYNVLELIVRYMDMNTNVFINNIISSSIAIIFLLTLYELLKRSKRD
ncbi:conserved hypothetical protein [Ignisphaera aggregans DSM 17230]|uniref:DUF373 family protein n=1 Tax=Ignisphaera aggregans (strain DSM 17230 / JCM 13409 / AQ1.S1) TaxID=583356 RepID=E0SP47_IGNAA|nr:conserved hypothetical protein [Ignisphaera aggregans DSM 17230]